MEPYNFLGLVNSLNHRLNEVPLTEANFAAADGWYMQAKQAVNSAIEHITHQETRWPWYYQKEELVLTPGQVRYNFPEDAQILKTDSFRLLKDDTIKNALLEEGDYEELLYSYDLDSPEATVGVPKTVFRYPDRSFGIYPPADSDYTLIYEYYKIPAELSEADDVPEIPRQWKHVITNGAMMYAYLFRSDSQAAKIMEELFKDNLGHMRKVYENRYVKVRSSVLRGR